MTTKQADNSKDELRQVLKRAAGTLMSFHIHLSYLTIFDEEMEIARQGHPAFVRNGIVWDTMKNSRDAFVIRFASWAKRTYSHPKGLFAVLRQDSKRLYVKKPKPPRMSSGAKTDLEMVEEIHDHQKYESDCRRYETFKMLFPDAADRNAGRVRQAEVDVLKDRLAAFTTTIVKDRDSNRAHPYREDSVKRKEVPELHTQELEAVLKQCKGLIADLHFVALDETMGSFPDNLVGTSSRQTAQKLVDLVLFDNDPGDLIYRANELMFESSRLGPLERRREAYRKLHEHFAATRSGDEFSALTSHWFNDPQEIWKLRVKPEDEEQQTVTVTVNGPIHVTITPTSKGKSR